MANLTERLLVDSDFRLKANSELTQEDLRDLQALHDKYIECGCRPSVLMVDQDPYLKTVAYYRERFGSLQKALALAAAGTIYRSLPVGWSQDSIAEFLILRLQQKASQLSSIPGVSDIVEDENMPHYQMYLRVFTSWSQALRAAGIMKPLVELQPPIKKRKRILWRHYQDQTILDMLRQKQAKLGRCLRVEDVDGDVELPSSHHLRARFGSWQKVLQLVGPVSAEG